MTPAPVHHPEEPRERNTTMPEKAMKLDYETIALVLQGGGAS
jgi:predicted acylesterase/phospholipase RssA